MGTIRIDLCAAEAGLDFARKHPRGDGRINSQGRSEWPAGQGKKVQMGGQCPPMPILNFWTRGVQLGRTIPWGNGGPCPVEQGGERP